uniref:Feruloyl esterase n=1 Tax=Ditylenchus dipsaci TaxID=166011 RepID=A0A915DTM3_9BILA
MTSRNLQLIKNSALPYIISIPSGSVPSDSGWPILCFLHGYDEAAPCPIQEGVSRHGPLNPHNPRRILDEFVVFAPQLDVAGDCWFQHADTVKEITKSIQKEHHGDPSRTYLTGFSYGGNGVFDLLADSPENWAAGWAVDPTRVPRQNIDCPLWISIGSAARRLTASFIQHLWVKPLDEEGWLETSTTWMRARTM